jgi:glycosyltransferase involved in cell wall biosynthesis
MIFIELLLLLLTMLLLLPVSIFFLQVVAALPAFKSQPLKICRRPSLAVLMPAHNEALVLPETLCRIFPQLIDGDRLLLVADNCSDDTAKIAKAAGAEVIERFDLKRRGKGYALDFGVRHLQTNPPDVVIVIDADCLVGEGAIDRLAKVCGETARPIQALYLMKSPPGAGLKARLAEFAWLVKNHVRPLGFLRLGLPCQLMGTGMAFPWAAIANVSLASGHIVEDMKLGIDLTRAGFPALFCPEALVTSVFPNSLEGTLTQRTRWEHGHLGMIVREAPRLFVEALFRGNLQLLALVLDLSIPPLAMLMMAVFTLFCVRAMFFALGGAVMPFILTGMALLLMGVAGLLAWWRFGQQLLGLKELAYAPVYALNKIPLYLKFLFGRQVEWVRSKRDEDSKSNRQNLQIQVKDQKYLLISPCRNEAGYMRQTLDTVIAQSVQPAEWVIVDDGSTDDTPKILAEYAQQHDWIKIITRRDRGYRSVGPGVIDAFYAGYETINPDEFDYLCKLDLDLRLPPRYFEILMVRMRENENIGTCSGKSYLEENGVLVKERKGDDTSLGMTKFYRVACFKEIGGFVREVMWDGIDCHRCRMLGWIACSWRDPELRFIHLRPMGVSQKNIYVGRMRHGYGQYFMGTGFLYILASALSRLNEKPYVLGSIAMLWGWLKSWMQRLPRYEYPGFRDFLSQYHWRALCVGKHRAVKEIEDRFSTSVE